MQNATYYSSAAIYCGHGISTDGSWDPGCTYKKNGKLYTEADLCLPITKWAVKYARACGVDVITDAFSKNNINMIKQVEKANKKKVKRVISVHCDYSKAPSGAFGIHASDKGLKLAESINKYVKKNMKLSVSTSNRNDLYELNETDAPCVIYEVGSIKADLDVIKDSPKKYGKQIARGLVEDLGLKWNPIQYIATRKVNGRTEPSTKTGVIEHKLLKGQNVTIWRLSDDKKWGYSMTYGWIWMNYLKKA